MARQPNSRPQESHALNGRLRSPDFQPEADQPAPPLNPPGLNDDDDDGVAYIESLRRRLRQSVTPDQQKACDFLYNHFNIDHPETLITNYPIDVVMHAILEVQDAINDGFIKTTPERLFRHVLNKYHDPAITTNRAMKPNLQETPKEREASQEKTAQWLRERYTQKE